MHNVGSGFSSWAVRRSEFVVIGAGLLALLLVFGCGGSGSTTGPGPTPEGDPTSIVIEPQGAAIAPGTSQQLSAIATYGNGATANVTGSVTWSSSNSSVLTVSNTLGSKGMATRLTDASVEVTATLDSVAGAMQITVWSEVIATSLRFDGDVSGVGTGFGVGHLAVDAGAVYWAGFDNRGGNTGGSIGKVLKNGGTPTTLASGLGGINALASDGAHVYWTEFELATGEGAVKRVPATGGAVEVLASGTPAGSAYDVFFPGGIAVDGSSVFWGEVVGGGAIRQVPKGSGTVTDLGRGQGFGPSALRISGGFLYGVTNNGGTGVAARLPSAGGSVETLASGLNNPASLAIDGQALYWAELVGLTGRIVRAPIAGGAATALATGLDNPRSVEVQGGNVYYAGVVRSGATPRMGIWKVGAGGGIPTLAVNASGTIGGFDPFSLVVDATHLFFVDGAWNTPGGARLLRAPRE